jgi:hypothetical protein
MNNKANTVLFIIVGTLVNLFLAISFIVLLLVAIYKLETIWPGRGEALFPFAFIAGILLSMLVYQRLSHWVVERFGLSDKLDPLFRVKHRRKKPKQD